jgi:hypothetical protein
MSILGSTNIRASQPSTPPRQARRSVAQPEVRTHRMTEDDVLLIVEAIHVHAGRKLTWKDVVLKSEKVVTGGFSRQALKAHPDIYAAYAKKKGALRGRSPSAPGERKTVEKALRTENANLRDTLQTLRLQISQHQINVALLGLDIDALERPLPEAHAERSDFPKQESDRLERQKQRRIQDQTKRAAARAASKVKRTMRRTH